MDFSDCIPAFTKEMMKLGFGSLRKSQEKAEKHFSSEKPDWKLFDKNLKSKKFREAISSHPKADAKLRKYVKNYGGFIASKDEIARVKSATSGKTYRIKDLHDGKLACSCPDWKYRRSVGRGACKHVRSLKKSNLLKESAAIGPFTRGVHIGTLPFVALNRAKKARAKNLAVKNVEQQVVARDRQKYGS